MNLIVGDH